MFFGDVKNILGDGNVFNGSYWGVVFGGCEGGVGVGGEDGGVVLEYKNHIKVTRIRTRRLDTGLKNKEIGKKIKFKQCHS